MVIYLDRRANSLHMVQLMPLPLTVVNFLVCFWCRLMHCVVEMWSLNFIFLLLPCFSFAVKLSVLFLYQHYTVVLAQPELYKYSKMRATYACANCFP